VSQIVLVTIGTADGEWALPQPVAFELDSNFDISNADEVRWRIDAKTRITMAAMWLRGQWWIAWAIDVPVRRGQDVIIEPGNLRINVEPPASVVVPAQPRRPPPPPQLPPGSTRVLPGG
jgi:hypothetical protein